jgi:hypothetical protein
MPKPSMICLRSEPVDLSHALLMEYRAAMLEKNLSASTVNVRLPAIRKLVGEAQWNGILDADQAAKTSVRAGRGWRTTQLF